MHRLIMNSADTWFTPVLYRVSDNCRTIHDYDAPFILVVGMRMMMIQKVALNSLKIWYVQAETPKYPRPCTLACNCKIIWVSDSGQVGGLPRKFQSYPLGEASKKIMLNFNFNRDFLFNWKSYNFGSGKISKSPSYAAHMSCRSSKPSKPSKRIMASQPAIKQASQPANQSVSQPASHPASHYVSQSVSQSVSQAASQSASQAANQSSQTPWASKPSKSSKPNRRERANQANHRREIELPKPVVRPVRITWAS